MFSRRSPREPKKLMRAASRNLFILLFVLGLVIASAVVIKSQEDQLGLDLQGGVELIYQGRADPAAARGHRGGDRAGDRHHPAADRALGVAEPEIARLGTDQISVGCRTSRTQQRAADQVGTTAQMYFYDWEPNLLGPAKQIGSHPGQSALGARSTT